LSSWRRTRRTIVSSSNAPRIREEESPEAPDAGTQRLRRADLVEPLRDRSAPEAGGDRAVPSTFGELEIAKHRLDVLLHLRQRTEPRLHLATAARVGPVKPEAVTQDPHGLEAERLRQRKDVLLLFLDQVGARLGVLPPRELIPQRPDTAANAVPCFDDGHRGAARFERPGRSQARQSCAGDDDAPACQISRRHP
jgi:hypothetical protein